MGSSTDVMTPAESRVTWTVTPAWSSVLLGKALPNRFLWLRRRSYSLVRHIRLLCKPSKCY